MGKMWLGRNRVSAVEAGRYGWLVWLKVGIEIGIKDG